MDIDAIAKAIFVYNRLDIYNKRDFKTINCLACKKKLISVGSILCESCSIAWNEFKSNLNIVSTMREIDSSNSFEEYKRKLMLLKLGRLIK